MTAVDRPLRPRGFGLFTRIVYIHQVLLLAFFVAALRLDSPRGLEHLLLPHLLGIVLSVLVLVAMFGVARRKSLLALDWLRVILWIGVVKILVVQLWLLGKGEMALAAYIRALLINELIAIPLAVYWSRVIHTTYLNAFRHPPTSLSA